jgi:hypothetical protein
MSEEVKFSPKAESEKVKAQFDQLVQRRDQAMKQRSEIDRGLNEIGTGLLRLQGAYEMAMRILGKDVEGNELVVPLSPKKEEKQKPQETIPGKKKK